MPTLEKYSMGRGRVQVTEEVNSARDALKEVNALR